MKHILGKSVVSFYLISKIKIKKVFYTEWLKDAGIWYWEICDTCIGIFLSEYVVRSILVCLVLPHIQYRPSLVSLVS